MCGILFTNNENINKSQFICSLNLMHHRGPDAEGYVEIGNAKFGHKRLKILDLDKRSNQPFYSHDGRYILIFNGEIYNYRQLAATYNIHQRTSSDTEVIVELYARYGPKFLNWINGMFALVIYDTTTNQIFIARDRLGVKPLYMHRKGDLITVSSEINSILKMHGINTFDEFGLRQYRKLRAFFNGRTAYLNVEMFPAGHYMLCNKIIRYWSLPEINQAPPTDEELLSLISESISQRLVSDVPVGSYLSGGVDSTIIASLAGEPHTWTVGFADNNEFEWARIAAQQIGSIHHEVLITADEFIEIANMLVEKRCEPLSVPNEVLLYKMTLEAKKNNTVILSGEGADELFFGYDRIFRWAENAVTWNLEDFTRLYAYGSNEDLEIVEDALSPFVHLKTPLDIVAHFFQIAHLHGLLRRLDNSTMLCSVEARVPFVDYHPLVERMAGVSFKYRMYNDVVKAPLKRIFKKQLPLQIIERKKVGFPVPLETIPFKTTGKSLSKMDRWLEYNISLLEKVIT
jgi:asparagine synthase (glutamine-hydrolysing)